MLQEQWEALALRLHQTQQQMQTCETAMVFAFVEVRTLKKSVKFLNLVAQVDLKKIVGVPEHGEADVCHLSNLSACVHI